MISCLAYSHPDTSEQPYPACVLATSQLSHNYTNSLLKLLCTSGGAGETLQPPRTPLQGAFGCCDPVRQQKGVPAAMQAHHVPWLRLQ